MIHIHQEKNFISSTYIKNYHGLHRDKDEKVICDILYHNGIGHNIVTKWYPAGSSDKKDL